MYRVYAAFGIGLLIGLKGEGARLQEGSGPLDSSSSQQY